MSYGWCHSTNHKTLFLLIVTCIYQTFILYLHFILPSNLPDDDNRLFASDEERGISRTPLVQEPPPTKPPGGDSNDEDWEEEPTYIPSDAKS